MNRGEVLLQPAPFGVLPAEAAGAPRIIEIGFGNGDFLVHLAQKRSDALIYGIEVSYVCIEKALSRIARLGLTNVRLLCGDARFLIRECFDDDSVDRIYMSFPCPWPKERHARRRVTSESFSGTIASVLKIGGVFELATDEGWYADEAAQILGAHPALRLAERKLNFRREITTKYEKRWLEMGKDIHHLYIEKTAPWSAGRMTERGCADMHVRIAPAIQVDRELLQKAAENGKGSCFGKHGEEGHWAFRGTYAAADGALLEETVCTDAGFEQKFYIKVVTKPECTLVKLDGVHIPFLTPSVRAAIEDLAQRIGQR